MHSILQQLPALLGVLVGAVSTYVATATGERARWRRSQAVRWDERKVEAYVEYAHALKTVISLTVRMAAYRGLETAGGSPLAPAEGEELLAEAEERRTTLWESVLLLGGDEVIAAARRWHESVSALQLAGGADWYHAVQVAGHARRDFYAAAKRDIGLRIGASTEAYEWQLAKYLSAS